MSRDLEKTICVYLESRDEFCLATWHGWDTSQLEFTEQTIIATLGPLSFVTVQFIRQTSKRAIYDKNIHRERNGRLIVLNGSEHA